MNVQTADDSCQSEYMTLTTENHYSLPHSNSMGQVINTGTAAGTYDVPMNHNLNNHEYVSA